MITVNDDVAPSITAPAATEVKCSSLLPAGVNTYAGLVTAGGAASDNCSGTIAISFSDATTPGTCTNKYTVTRTYKATDVCGNTATSNQVITVNDDVAPSITAPAATEVKCSSLLPAGVNTYAALVTAGGAASDNCSGTIAISFSDATTRGTCTNKYTVTRTYKATDVCGNTATSNQVITVNDDVAPSITAPAATEVKCASLVPAGITYYSTFVSAGGAASDNCSGTIAISFSDATTPGTCTNKYTVTRTYKATDVCGNTATSNQVITVNDDVAPSITAPAATEVKCSSLLPAGVNTYAALVTAGGAASDNCSGTIAISFSDATTPGTCTNKYTVTRTYKATDVCGNTATSNQVITVNDDVAPSITAPAATEVKCASLVPAGITYYSTFVSAGGQPVIIAVERLRSASVNATTPGTCTNKYTVTRPIKQPMSVVTQQHQTR